MTSQFGLTVKELRELMEFRGHEGVDKVAELGGVHEICSKLKTSEAEG
jgi:Ca2+ transporting ATPase